MSRVTLPLLLLGLLPGCVLAIGVDEDSFDDDEGSRGWHVAHFRSSGGGAAGAGVVSGTVRGADARAVEARIVAVYPSGSYSQTTEDGSFSLGPLPAGDFLLKASTEGGEGVEPMVALASDLTLSRGQGLANLELTLEPGATLVLSYEGGGEKYRCAVFHGGLRVDDFTLRKGGEERVVVPPGRIPVQLYEDERILGVREVVVTPGSVTEVVLQAD